MNKFTHALLFPKPDSEKAVSATDKIQENLEGAGIICHTVIDLSQPLPDVPDETTLAVMLGGDGTFLLSTQALYGRHIPITGVNLGNLGFLAEASANNLLQHLDTLLMCNKRHQEQRPYYIAEFTDTKGNVVEAPFVNDAVLHREACQKMVHFTLHAQLRGTDRLMTSTRADGLIVSTPTGSTAYNLSTGGPVIHPDTDALVLAPICPHALSFRPVVMPPAAIRVTLEDSEGTLSLDGQQWQKMTPGTEVVIKKSNHTFTILHTQQRNFFHTLRQKLGWDS